MATVAAVHDPGEAAGDAVERALSVPTRAGIYRRLRTEGQPVTARDAAEMFGLHPNVARNHLDTLAEAGLVVTGRRKHPAVAGPPRSTSPGSRLAATGPPPCPRAASSPWRCSWPW